MAWRPRASERARAGLDLPRARGAGDRASRALLALVACVLGGACRQTVVLDPGAEGALTDGGAAGGGGAPEVDDGGGRGGSGMNGGGHNDGGSRPEVLPFCFGGQLQSVPITMRTPDVIISVDRSSSMQSWFGGTSSRLQVIHQEVSALVQKYKLVKFGYEEFPALMGTCGNGQGCCSGDVALPNFHNGMVIQKVLNACDNGGAGCDQQQRPIADALSKCSDAFDSLFSPGDTGHRYVLLITGGDPTCQGAGSTSTPCDDANTQVVKMSNHFINTGVFSVGDNTTASPCLNQLALYGGIPVTVPASGDLPLYYVIKTPNDLSAQLDPVVETIADEACTIDVTSPPADPTKVQLLFDGVPVPNDGVDGWSFDADTNVTLTVHGSYCAKLIETVDKVELVTGCPLLHN
jgi:hypothetical protein